LTQAQLNTASEVLPGIWQLRVQLPGHRLGWLNSYLLKSEQGVILIDTPWNTVEVRTNFLELIAETSTELEDIRIVLLTHYHDDHSGCAAHLRHQGASVAVHPADTDAMRLRIDGSAYKSKLVTWLGRVGADAALSDFAFAQEDRLRARFEFPETDIPLEDGQIIEVGEWKILVLHTPGHTPGSVCFFELNTGTLFSGDHVFPSRRSNAVHRPIGPERPLKEYWSAMARLVELDPVRVMPGHEHQFGNFIGRVDELIAVRDNKLKEMLGLVKGLAGGATAHELAPRVRRSREWADLDDNSKLTAVGETLAYLVELESESRIQAVGTLPERWQLRKEAVKI
jgi:glyoxylase-like metal-dependent hydrolase (beta-lactamase superfamily II)